MTAKAWCCWPKRGLQTPKHWYAFPWVWPLAARDLPSQPGTRRSHSLAPGTRKHKLGWPLIWSSHHPFLLYHWKTCYCSRQKVGNSDVVNNVFSAAERSIWFFRSSSVFLPLNSLASHTWEDIWAYCSWSAPQMLHILRSRILKENFLFKGLFYLKNRLTEKERQRKIPSNYLFTPQISARGGPKPGLGSSPAAFPDA